MIRCCRYAASAVAAIRHALYAERRAAAYDDYLRCAMPPHDDAYFFISTMAPFFSLLLLSLRH